MKNLHFGKKISRRDFCKFCLLSGASLAVSPILAELLKDSAEAAEEKGGMGFVQPREAMYYEKLDKDTIQCHLCPRQCTLKNGMKGFCRARGPRGGKHYSYVYGNPTAIHVDPIEKKPLFHFLPATSVFSIATAGCNFRCKYCQNWQISQFPPEETFNENLPPKAVVGGALKYGCPTIAYTYSEPSIFYEYMLDTAKIAKGRGIRNVYHSNGSLNSKPVEEISLYLDGVNIDLKGFTQDFYSKIPEGNLEAVCNTIKILKKNLVHVEVTNLVVPPYNDDMNMIRNMCRWLGEKVGKDTPLHFSRFWPTYKLKNLSPTPVKTLEEARKTAMEEGLLYVYIGNVPGHEAENTYCPTDGKVIIRRRGYQVLENNVIDGKCKFCGREIPGIWETKGQKKNSKKISDIKVSSPRLIANIKRGKYLG